MNEDELKCIGHALRTLAELVEKGEVEPPEFFMKATDLKPLKVCFKSVAGHKIWKTSQELNKV